MLATIKMGANRRPRLRPESETAPKSGKRDNIRAEPKRFYWLWPAKHLAWAPETERLLKSRSDPPILPFETVPEIDLRQTHHSHAGRLLTEGGPMLDGTFILATPARRRKSADHQPVDGRFSCADGKALAEVLASGFYSILETAEGETYVVKLIDSAGFFTIVEQPATRSAS